jgi:ribonuclease HI
MLSTLYCDASWSHHRQRGGWAVWLRSNDGRIIEHGRVPDYCTLSYEAELAAIFAGVHLATKKWPTTEAVLIRSDCRQALDLIGEKRPPKAKHPGACRLVSKILEVRDAAKVRLIPRWVKGHQDGQKVDAWLNRRVDLLSRRSGG